MAEQGQVYKCELCGNIIEVLTGAPGALACCGQNMDLMVENTTDAAVEKHLPVIEVSAEGILVKVGSVDHPMTDDHFIEWIELINEGTVHRVHLTPRDEPKACFPPLVGAIHARAYCNLHGLWKA